MRVRIFELVPGSGELTVFDKTYDEVEHYDGDIWLANSGGVESFIRPGCRQRLLIEGVQKDA